MKDSVLLGTVQGSLDRSVCDREFDFPSDSKFDYDRAVVPAENPRRETLISAASDLFCQHGIHGVGIDWILEEAGVAKATLYKHFPSKDDLVVAALQETGKAGRDALERAVEESSECPRERFLALAALTARSTQHGCVFMLAAQEFPERSHPVHKQSVAHKRAIREIYGRLAVEAGSSLAAADAGSQVQLVLEGVYAAVALGPADSKRAIEAAERLLELLLEAK